jgi:hypothetical protein
MHRINTLCGAVPRQNLLTTSAIVSCLQCSPRCKRTLKQDALDSVTNVPFTWLLLLLPWTAAAQAAHARLSEYLTCALECKPSSASSSSNKHYKVQNGMTFLSTQRQQQLAAAAAARLINVTVKDLAGLSARRGSGRRSKRSAAAGSSRTQPLDLSHRTVPMTAKGLDGTPHYDTHNLYGWAEAAATYDALASITKKRPFVLTR